MDVYLGAPTGAEGKTDILTLKIMKAETGCLVHTTQGEEINALSTRTSARR